MNLQCAVSVSTRDTTIDADEKDVSWESSWKSIWLTLDEPITSDLIFCFWNIENTCKKST